MFKSLKSRFIGASISVIVIAVFILTIVFSITATSEMEDMQGNNALKTIEFTKKYIYAQYLNINNHEMMLLDTKRSELKSAVDILESEMALIYQEYLEEGMSEEKAKKMLLDLVSRTTYDNEQGYFWLHELTDKTPKMVLHPRKPELDGQVLEHFSYNSIVGSNENIFIYASRLIDEAGEGYFEYYWYDDDQIKKLAYVRSIAMFDWVLGTSYDLTNVQERKNELYDEMLTSLSDFNRSDITDEGYFFIFDSQMDMIVHHDLAGTNVAYIINPLSGDSLISEMMGIADFEGTYLTYPWNRPNDLDNYIYEKRAYVTYFEPFDWYIVSSFYVDTTQDRIKNILSFVLLITSSLLFLSFVVSYFIGSSVTKPLRLLVEQISQFNYGNLPDHLDVEGSNEVNMLTHSMNNMIQNINSSRKSILETHSRLQGILDSATKMAIITTDTTGVIESFNIGAENMLGYKANEVLYKESPNLFHLKSEVDRRCEELSEIYMRDISGFDAFVAVVDEAGYEEREWTYVRKDGSQLTVNLTVTSVFGREGELTGYLGIANDISAKKETDEKLKKRTDELRSAVKNLIAHEEHLEDMVRERTIKLEESLKTLQDTQDQLIESEKMALLGSLVAGVAHEINTPVGIGVTLASSLADRTEKIKILLEDGKLTRKQIDSYVDLMQEIGNMLGRSMQQAADLIQSFKLVAVDQSVENKREFELNEYLNEILNSFGSKFERASIDIRVHGHEEINLMSYPGTFYQIFTNLLMNSMKHGFDGRKHGNIDIELTQDDKHYIILYKDDGVGIEADELERIFEPFYTTKRHKGGTGLGLNIVNNLVHQKLKGSLTTSSSPGEGIQFVITIPKEEMI